MDFRTRLRVPSATEETFRITKEAVARETPASAAMSRSVTRRFGASSINRRDLYALDFDLFIRSIWHFRSILYFRQEFFCEKISRAAPIHESCLRLGDLLKTKRSADRWWSSDKADWKSVVV